MTTTTTEQPPTVDGHVVSETHEVAQPSTALATVPPPPQQYAVTPSVTAADLGARLDVIQQAMRERMTPGLDYGRVEGVSKPTLLKPGAEKLGVLFELDLQPTFEEVNGPGDHLRVTCHVVAFHAPSQTRLGAGRGVCSTKERKYAKRKLERECPVCNKNTILESRKEDQPGFFCWRKKGGCGQNFPPDDERLTRQEVGEIDNPDLADTWNTVVKIASKRAKVDAVLSVTGASALFTQDVEDGEKGDTPQPEHPHGAPAAEEYILKTGKPALAYLLGLEQDDPDVPIANRDEVNGILAALTADYGYVPQPAVRALSFAARAAMEAHQS